MIIIIIININININISISVINIADDWWLVVVKSVIVYSMYLFILILITLFENI